MTIEQIKQVARAIEFRPFSLETAGGQRIAVDHPEYIFLVEGHSAITVYSKTQDVVELINADRVASIRIKTPDNT